MKTLITVVLTVLGLSVPAIQAGDSIVPLGGGGFGVLRGGGNLYRPVPRGTGDETTGRYRRVFFKPTQHFYTKDKVVSYRYSEDFGTRYGSKGNAYLGPRGSIFTDVNQSVQSSVRSYASVNRRPQPGVGMTSGRTSARSTAAAPIGTSSIVSVAR